jgi:hypothetical protein
MNRSLLVVVCLLIGAFGASSFQRYKVPSDPNAPQAYPYPGNNLQPWQVGMVTLPSTATTVQPITTFLDKAWFSNTTGSDVTVTLVDNTTNCSGGPCQLWPGVDIPANTAQSVTFNGLVANGGFKWSASSANAIHGWIAGAL